MSCALKIFLTDSAVNRDMFCFTEVSDRDEKIEGMLLLKSYFRVGMHSSTVDMTAPLDRLQNASHSMRSSML